MRTLKTSLMLILLALLVVPAMADGDFAEAKGDRPGRGDFRQKMLEEFDADGDGELNEDERANAREKMRGRRGKEGAKGRRGGRGGEGPPNPEELFDRFDADGDNQLSREEFHNLAESMREHHEKMRRGKGPRGEGQGRRQGHQHGPPDGPRDRPGPRGEGGRDFRPPGPLQNPGDRPPRAGKGRRGPGGSGGHGKEGRPRPNPDEMFDRFDEDSNGQLSRGEFLELSRAMRERHKHSGRGDGKKPGKGRGDRQGSSRRGRFDRERPPHHHDSDKDAELESSSAEDDSI